MQIFRHQNSFNSKPFSEKDKRLIYKSVNPFDILSPEPGERVTKVLSPIEAATEHMKEMGEAAEKEMQKPIKKITDSIQTAIKAVLGLPGVLWQGTKKLIGSTVGLAATPLAMAGALTTNAVSETGKLATGVIGGTLGAAANAPRWAWDAGFSLAAKIPTVISDYGGKALGTPSRWIESGTKKMTERIDKISAKVKSIGKSIHDKAMSVIGAGNNGGPAHHTPAASH